MRMVCSVTEDSSLGGAASLASAAFPSALASGDLPSLSGACAANGAAGANHRRIAATPRNRPFRIVPLLLGLPIRANPLVRADSIRAAEDKSKVRWALRPGVRIEAGGCPPPSPYPFVGKGWKTGNLKVVMAFHQKDCKAVV